MAICHQRAEVLLQCVAILAGQALGVADGQATVVSHEVQELRRNFREATHQKSFTLNLYAETMHLALQRGQEEAEPRFPVRTVRPDRSLGLSKGQIVGLLALLDHAFEGGVRYIGIA